MSNLTVRKAGGVMVDLDALNYDIAGKAIDRIMEKTGAQTFKRNFPGTQYTFKKGQYVIGFGKTKKLADDLEMVVNVPHLMTGYVKFEDTGDGKSRPTYTPPCLPMAGMELVDRDELGDTDSEEWDVDDYGNPRDPWQVYCVFPIREKDGAEVHHFQTLANSHNRVMYGFFKELLAEMKLKPGKLPVVSFGSKSVSMDKKTTDKKSGREKTKKMEWDVPELTVTGWVSVAECDRMNAAVDMGEEGGGDVGEVEKIERTAPKSATKAKAAAAPVQKAAATPAPKGKTKRKVSDDEI